MKTPSLPERSAARAGAAAPVQITLPALGFIRHLAGILPSPGPGNNRAAGQRSLQPRFQLHGKRNAFLASEAVPNFRSAVLSAPEIADWEVPAALGEGSGMVGRIGPDHDSSVRPSQKFDCRP